MVFPQGFTVLIRLFSQIVGTRTLWYSYINKTNVI